MSRRNSDGSSSYLMSLFRSVTVSLLTLLIVVALIGVGLFLGSKKDSGIDDNSWLVLDLYGDLPSYNPPGALFR